MPKVALEAARETLQDSGQPPAGAGMTFMEARTASEVLKVQTARINLQRLKGEVIDPPRANAHAFRFAREERDAWLNWPARVAALMAAELGVDAHKVHVAPEKHVRDHLSELAEIKPKFRRGLRVRGRGGESLVAGADAGAGAHTTLPGFMIPLGSSAAFSVRISSISTSLL